MTLYAELRALISVNRGAMRTRSEWTVRLTMVAIRRLRRQIAKMERADYGISTYVGQEPITRGP